NQAVFPLGTTVAFSGVATDVEDGDVSAALQWTSSLDGALGTGPRVSSSSLRIGTHTITASATDSSGHPGEARMSLRVRGPNTAPAVTITAPPSDGSAFAGTPVTLAATATHDFDPDPSAGIRWSSSLDGDLGAGGGLAGEATRSVVIRPPNVRPVITVQAPVDGAALLASRPVVLAALATDVEDGDLGAAVRWASSLGGPLGAGATLTIPALPLG